MSHWLAYVSHWSETAIAHWGAAITNAKKGAASIHTAHASPAGVRVFIENCSARCHGR